ncbi:MAG: GNAT family N-acetyltransferase [Lachnospiraceae bacterium]|nr:GNAT family N-acetyltransferase [Lachnospiraceae bacterium]
MKETEEGAQMITLKPVTQENLEEVLSLHIKEEQRGFVSSPAESLAQAYVYYETAYPFAVYAEDIPIGFIMMGYYEAKDYYTLWKFLIDQRYQSKGYGRRALKLGLEYMKDTFAAKEIYTGVIPGNEVAKRLYESVGFKSTGLFEAGMEEMKLVIVS